MKHKTNIACNAFSVNVVLQAEHRRAMPHQPPPDLLQRKFCITGGSSTTIQHQPTPTAPTAKLYYRQNIDVQYRICRPHRSNITHYTALRYHGNYIFMKRGSSGISDTGVR